MHRSSNLFVGAGMLLSLCPIPIAGAQTTWYVDDDEPPCCYPPNCDGTTPEEPFCKIQDGINAASNGDEVVVLDGTYDVVDVGLDNTRRLWFGSPARAITLRSQNGPQNCIIDCQGSAGSQCRAFDFYQDNASRSTVVEGFTIKGGYAERGTDAVGGGIRCVRSEPTIRGCVIEGNYASDGGGIGFKGDSGRPSPWSPLVTDCTIRDNHTLSYYFGGGGIYCSHHSDVDIVNCSIVGNTSLSSSGGGIYWDDGCDLYIIDCAIVGNTAEDDGGGVYGAWKEALPTRPTWLKRCTIVRNSVEQGSGGGVAVANTQNVLMWMVNNVIAGNEGRGGGSNGGGLAILGYWSSHPVAPEVHLVNVLFAGNVAREGGGVYMKHYMHPDAEIADCTVVGNVANSLGGGIRRGDVPSTDPLDVSNIIVRDNLPSNNQISEHDVNSFDIYYSDVIGVDAQEWDEEGNITADPLFAGGTWGTWTSDADCNSAPGKSKFFDTAQWTDGELVGKLLNPDTAQHLQSVIVANEADSITVWGDFCNLDGDGELDEEYQINDYRLTGTSPCIDAASNPLVPEDVTDLDEDANIAEKMPRDIVMAPRHLDAELVGDTGDG